MLVVYFNFQHLKLVVLLKIKVYNLKYQTSKAITILYGSNKPKGNNDPEYNLMDN